MFHGSGGSEVFHAQLIVAQPFSLYVSGWHVSSAGVVGTGLLKVGIGR
jgi:hypothetical protein